MRTTQQWGRQEPQERDIVPESKDGSEASSPIEENVSELDSLQTERDRYFDQLQRSMAEFANYRKRVDQERSLARQLANRDLLLRLVPIADDLKRAMTSIPEQDAGEAWLNGITLIERNLAAFLDREGVRPMEALYQPFDPSVHEAVAVVPGSSGSTVVDVFQNGYWHGDQVLRPAMVLVGDPVSPNEQRDQPDA